LSTGADDYGLQKPFLRAKAKPRAYRAVPGESRFVESFDYNAKKGNIRG
jgi:hypothetical protein